MLVEPPKEEPPVVEAPAVAAPAAGAPPVPAVVALPPDAWETSEDGAL